MTKTTWQSAPALLALVAACSGEGNTGKVSPPGDQVGGVPWTNGVAPPHDERGAPVVPQTPVYPPIGDGTPDPGSRAVDCGALAGVELAAWVETFEPSLSFGVAEAWSSYDDGTPGAFRAPGDAAWYSGVRGQYGEAWGLPADRIAGPSCDGQPNEWAFHFRGGRFNWYGAGTSHPLATGFDAQRHCPEIANEEMPRADFCPPPRDQSAAVDPIGVPADSLFAYSYWDLSTYDGVVFWARRGPESQPGIMVSLQNKYTSDELARENELHCQRIKTCVPRCENRAPCVPDDTGVERCIPEGANPSLAPEPALVEELYPRCGNSACSSPSYFPDPDFDDTQCKAYEFSGMESNYYCYGDEPPPRAIDRCGDAFVAPVRLSTDWQLYKVPFTEFRQVGFGKPAPAMDLKSIFSIGFQFPVGFADVYVDNVSFYRNSN